MNTNVLRAVFSRNFVSYFANPTGYVFICVFVLLSSFAAFWPFEFFNSNLANLDQLNKVFPFIMLIFIPAITMSVWAEERRIGTDELLLTIPAGDFDIVLGKYLAALAIYSVSLAFSMFCNFIMLAWLSMAQLDVGLFMGTYFGYWLVGVAMLAVGMIASFLTQNLTIGFILGAVFNAPLVFAVTSDAIFGPKWARLVKEWSIGEQFGDFGRGMLSLSGVTYFVAIMAVMLYLSMVFIGRRHWARGRDWHIMACHFLVRTVSLGVLAVCAITLFYHFDVRLDATSAKLSSLSSETRTLLKELDPQRPVQIEAFVSPDVPESYVQARLDLLQMLRELRARGGGKVSVLINETERFSEEAARAERRYNIRPRRVVSLRRGAMAEDYIFMGVAFTSGLEKVTLPFVDRGIPVEYELVRSICTITQQKRKKVGILQTDAQLFGQFNMQTMSSSPNWPIIAELEKMYEVVRIDPSAPITEDLDALLAVQPSSLTQEQMTNFIAAVRQGIPTAIFEDPFPGFASQVPATSAPKRPPGGMNPMMRQQAPPKGNIIELWNMLGVDFSANQIVWQNYNPYPKLGHLPNELVFIGGGEGGKGSFNQEHNVSSGLELLLFPFAGSVTKLNSSPLTFDALVRTGDGAGIVRYDDMMQMSPFGPRGLNPNRNRIPANESYVLAAQIQGTVPAAMPESHPPEENKPEGEKPQETEVNVIVIADIDMLHREFFMLREQGANPEVGVDFQFDNVTFVLNALDVLAGDERFVSVRKRRPKHYTLQRIDERVEAARRATAEMRNEQQEQFKEAQQKTQQDLDKAMDELRKRMQEEKLDEQEILRRVMVAMKNGQRQSDTRVEQLRTQMERKLNEIETEQAVTIRQVQDRYKFWAVALPPIPPLIVAVFVFFLRRSREREGVSRSRLR